MVPTCVLVTVTVVMVVSVKVGSCVDVFVVMPPPPEEDVMLLMVLEMVVEVEVGNDERSSRSRHWPLMTAHNTSGHLSIPKSRHVTGASSPRQESPTYLQRESDRQEISDSIRSQGNELAAE